MAEGLVTGRFRGRSDDGDEHPEPASTDAGSATDPADAPTPYPAPPDGDGSGSVPSLGSATGPGQARYHREVARIGAQVADALAHAHALGVLHRDVKPSNLLLDARGDAWVADFGLAKLEEAEDLTDTGDVLGTLRYMAPERFDGKSDRRGDIYALGATLYEMIVLRPAFDAPDRARLVRQILEEDPPSLRKLDRRVPRDLETIVHKAMARDASARYQTAGDDGRGPAAIPPGPADRGEAQHAGRADLALVPPQPGCRGHGGVAAGRFRRVVRRRDGRAGASASRPQTRGRADARGADERGAWPGARRPAPTQGSPRRDRPWTTI